MDGIYYYAIMKKKIGKKRPDEGVNVLSTSACRKKKKKPPK
jgi:hypothetical protein